MTDSLTIRFNDQALTLRMGENTEIAASYAAAAAASAAEAEEAMSNPRAETLSDAARYRVPIVPGGVFIGGPADTTGAFKIKLPIGIDPRFMALSLAIKDQNGLLLFDISGTNNDPWTYAGAQLRTDHAILGVADLQVRFGKDGTGPCIWIGNTTLNVWQYPQVWIREVDWGTGTITETWLGDWEIDLVTSFDTVTAGPITPTAPVSSDNVKIDTTRLAVAIGPGATTGTRASNYQVMIGALAGSGSVNDFNNVGIGLQSFSESDGSSASTAVGLQALQHARQVTNGTAIATHALLSLEIGVNMTAVGAGSQQYAVNTSRSTSLGAYAGRDNQADDCLFLGNNAGMLSTAEAGAFHVAKDETESLLRGNFNTRYLDVNGTLSSEGVRPLADNTYSLGTSSLRYSVVYAGTGAINTSDERMKRDIGAIPDEWLDAWGEVEWSRFKFVDGTRWHTGLVAQRVHAAFARHGLDAFEIGLCCLDSWDEETEAVTELRPVEKLMQRPLVVNGVVQWTTKKVGEQEDGSDLLAPVPVMEDYTETIEQLFETGETRVVREAGELWGLRYDECQAMEAAWVRRELARLRAA